MNLEKKKLLLKTLEDAKNAIRIFLNEDGSNKKDIEDIERDLDNKFGRHNVAHEKNK